jgi:hypothetical protein
VISLPSNQQSAATSPPACPPVTTTCVGPRFSWIARAARSACKDDEADARALARLLRLGELKKVYQPESDRRALFKQAAGHYTDLRDQKRALKQKIKARLKRWGHWNIPSSDVYSKTSFQAT